MEGGMLVSEALKWSEGKTVEGDSRTFYLIGIEFIRSLSQNGAESGRPQCETGL